MRKKNFEFNLLLKKKKNEYLILEQFDLNYLVYFNFYLKYISIMIE